MAGYIGKVAAVLSVNTSDIPGKIQSGFVAPMDRALRQVENTLRNTNRSITKSFDDIYTQSQKVARARAFAAAGAVKGFDDVDFGKRLRIRDDIAEPVKRLATAIEKTSGAVRGQFEPAIVAVQAAAQSLFDRMATDAASVTQGEIAQMISRVESLAAAFDYANTASARMADGWANMNRAGRDAAESRRRQEMFAGAGAAGRGNLRDLQRMRDFDAMVGQSSPINWQTPWRRGLAAPAGATNTGMGVNASSSIAGQGARTTLPPDYFPRLARERDAARQMQLDESSARARDAAMRRIREEQIRQQEEAARLSSRAAVDRRGAVDEFRGSFGGRGAAGLGLGLDQRALAGATAELTIIQRAISRASAEARGPAVAAFLQLRNAIADAFESGTIESEATRRNLAALRQEAVNAAAQVAGVSRRGLGRDVQRAGDVSRGGLDKFSLAAQQAGFALDDFFSSTGGIDMKIRAVSNNISQLAFILGGTAGLFTGLAFTIGSQVVVALMKWADAGRTSADYTKSLNEALENQKRIVESLAGSYRDLAKSFSSAQSPAAGRRSQRDSLFAEIASKRRQGLEESIYANDTGVASARARVTAEERLGLLAVTSTQMQTAQFRVKLAKRDEDRAKREALEGARTYNAGFGQGPAAGSAVQAGIQIAIQRFGDLQMARLNPQERRIFGEAINARINAVPMQRGPEEAAKQLRDFIENEIATNQNARDPGPIGASIVGDLLQQLARLEFGLKEANSKVIDGVNRSLEDASVALDSAQATISGAAMETPEIASIRNRIDQTAASLEALSLAASETTDKGVLAAIAEDAEAQKGFIAGLEEAGKKARAFADSLQKAIAEEAAAADRGEQLGRRRDNLGRVDDIRARASQILNGREREQFVRDAFGNIVKDETAFRTAQENERFNAIAGGPSRQELSASDVASMDGQRELNRLLRGDDPSRDANFAEMRQQTDLLQQIAEGIKQATGVVVDFR